MWMEVRGQLTTDDRYARTTDELKSEIRGLRADDRGLRAEIRKEESGSINQRVPVKCASLVILLRKLFDLIRIAE